MRHGDPATFFAPSKQAEIILKKRALALSNYPHRYAAAVLKSMSLIQESGDCMMGWSGASASFESITDPIQLCISIGKFVETDWVLLSADAENGHPVVAGVVCFPSAWSLPEKLGLPLDAVHRPAPTVNSGLGSSIGTFLRRLKPGEAWQRENWGISADDSLDHHPDLAVQPLTGNATPATTWLRLESQLLIRLPRTNVILFGIRVTVHRLDALAAIPGLAPRIARALKTMPKDIARYKGLNASRSSLVAALEEQ